MTRRRSSASTLRTPTEKNLVGDYSGLRSDASAGVLEIAHIAARESLADFLTKAGASLALYWALLRQNHLDLATVSGARFETEAG